MTASGSQKNRISKRSSALSCVFLKALQIASRSCDGLRFRSLLHKERSRMAKGMSPLRLVMRNAPRKTLSDGTDGSSSGPDGTGASTAAQSRQPLGQITEIVRNPLITAAEQSSGDPSTPRAKARISSQGQEKFPHLENSEVYANSINTTPDKTASSQSKGKFSWQLRRGSTAQNTPRDGAPSLTTPPRFHKGSACSDGQAANNQDRSITGGGSVPSTPKTSRSVGGKSSTVSENCGSQSQNATPCKTVSRSLKYSQQGSANNSGASGLTNVRSTVSQHVITRPIGYLQAAKVVLPQTTNQNFVQHHFELEEDSSFWRDHNVQVIIRTRPLSNSESTSQGPNRCLKQESPHVVSWLGQPESRFTFDHVAGETITQAKLFDVAGLPMVENCMSGYNSCMFAYGQTGSGKTHTMLGDIENLDRSPSENRGMTPRVFEYLFARIQKEQECRRHDHLKFFCKCSFLEIYNEQIIDLLEPSSTNLQMREDTKKGVYVENLSEVEVQCVQDVIQLLLQGASNRKVAATNMNRESSRSHSVFTCVVESKWEKNSMTNSRYGRLHLVDLAGSERQKSSGAEGGRLKEAANINKSLSTLGLVIMILVDVANGRQRHVPYRDSKLTFLLQDSLGGNSKTIMIANVSPSSCCAMETLSTLKFAQRAKFIRNNAVINEDASGDVIALRQRIEELKIEVDRLRHENMLRVSSSRILALENGSIAGQQCGDKFDSSTSDCNVIEASTLDSRNANKSQTVPIANNDKQLRAIEAVLAGALRREQEAEDITKKLAAEIEQLNRLVRQREEDSQCSKMILRFRDEKIRRLESIADNVISAEATYEDERKNLIDELQLIRGRLDRNPELTRFAMENIRLMEELRRYQEFYDGGERDVLLQEISGLRSQLLDMLDTKVGEEQTISKLLTPQRAVAPELSALERENELLLIEVKSYQNELKDCRDNLNSCLVANAVLSRQVDELQATMNQLTHERSQKHEESKELLVSLDADRFFSGASHPVPQEATSPPDPATAYIRLEPKELDPQQREALATFEEQVLELRNQLKEAQDLIQKLSSGVEQANELSDRRKLKENETCTGDDDTAVRQGLQDRWEKLQEIEMRHSEEIAQLQLELDSIEDVLKEERQQRLFADQKIGDLTSQLSATASKSEEAERLAEDSSKEDRQLRLLAEQKGEELSSQLSAAISKLEEAHSVVKALEGKQISINEEIAQLQLELESTQELLKDERQLRLLADQKIDDLSHQLIATASKSEQAERLAEDSWNEERQLRVVAEQRSEELSSQLSAAVSKVEEAHSVVEALEGKQISINEEIAQLQLELESTEELLKEERQLRLLADQKIDDLSNQLIATASKSEQAERLAEQKGEELSSQLSAAVSKLEESHSVVEALEGKQISINEEIAQLQLELESTQELLKEETQLCLLAHEKNDNLSHQLIATASKSEEAERLAEDSWKEERQLRVVAEQKSDELSSQLSAAVSKLEEARTVVEAVEGKQFSVNEEIAQLQLELESTKECLTEERQLRLLADQKIEDLSNELIATASKSEQAERLAEDCSKEDRQLRLLAEHKAEELSSQLSAAVSKVEEAHSVVEALEGKQISINEEIAQLQLELESTEELLKEERQLRLLADQKLDELSNQLNTTASKSEQAERVAEDSLKEERQLRLVAEEKGEELSCQLSAAVSKLGEAHSVVEALEGKQISINEEIAQLLLELESMEEVLEDERQLRSLADQEIDDLRSQLIATASNSEREERLAEDSSKEERQQRLMAEEKIEELSCQLIAAVSKVEESHSVVEALEGKQMPINEQITQLQLELESLEEVLKDERQQNLFADQKIDELSNQLNARASNSERAERLAEDSSKEERQQRLVAEEKSEELSRQLSGAVSKLGESHSVVEALEGQQISLTELITQLQLELESMEEVLKDERQQNLIADQKIDDLSHQLIATASKSEQAERLAEASLKEETQQRLVAEQKSEELSSQLSAAASKLEEAHSVVEALEGQQISINEQITQLQLELESLVEVLKEERQERLFADQQIEDLRSQLSATLSKLEQAERLAEDKSKEERQLRLVAEQKGEELSSQLSAAVSKLEEAHSVVEALEGQQLFSINELEDLQAEHTKLLRKMKEEEEGKVELQKHFQDENTLDYPAVSILEKKLLRSKREKDEARRINRQFQLEKASRMALDKEREVTMSEVETQAALVITTLQSEILDLREEASFAAESDATAKLQISHLQKEVETLRQTIGHLEDSSRFLSGKSEEYRSLVDEKHAQLRGLEVGWESSASKLMDYLSDGDKALSEAVIEMDEIQQTKIQEMTRMGDNHMVEKRRTGESVYHRLQDVQLMVRETEAEVRTLSDGTASLAETTIRTFEDGEAMIRESEKKSMVAFLMVGKFLERIRDLKAALQVYESQDKSVKEAMKDIQAAALQQQLEQLRLEYGELQDQHELVIREREDLKQQNHRSSLDLETVKDLKADHIRLKKEIQESCRALGEKDVENGNLYKQLNESHAQSTVMADRYEVLVAAHERLQQEQTRYLNDNILQAKEWEELVRLSERKAMAVLVVIEQLLGGRNDLKALNMGLAKEIQDGSLLLAEKQTAIDALEQKLEHTAHHYKEIAGQYELLAETHMNLEHEHNGLLAEEALRVQEGEALVKLSERKAMAAFVVLDDLLERVKELQTTNSSLAVQIGEVHVTLAEKETAVSALQNELSQYSDVARRHWVLEEAHENLRQDHERFLAEKALRVEEGEALVQVSERKAMAAFVVLDDLLERVKELQTTNSSLAVEIGEAYVTLAERDTAVTGLQNELSEYARRQSVLEEAHQKLLQDHERLLAEKAFRVEEGEVLVQVSERKAMAAFVVLGDLLERVKEFKTTNSSLAVQIGEAHVTLAEKDTAVTALQNELSEYSDVARRHCVLEEAHEKLRQEHERLLAEKALRVEEGEALVKLSERKAMAAFVVLDDLLERVKELQTTNSSLTVQMGEAHLTLAEKDTAVTALQNELSEYLDVAGRQSVLEEAHEKLRQDHERLLAEKALRVEEGEALVQVSERKAMAAFVVLDDLLERVKELRTTNSCLAKQIGEAHGTLAENNSALATLHDELCDNGLQAKEQEELVRLSERKAMAVLVVIEQLLRGTNDLKASNMGLAKEIQDGSLLLAEKQTAIDALEQKLDHGAHQYMDIADQYELLAETHVNLEQEHNGLLAEKALAVEGEVLVKLSERKAMAAFVVLDDLLERMKELKTTNSCLAVQIGEAHGTSAEKDTALASLHNELGDNGLQAKEQEELVRLSERKAMAVLVVIEQLVRGRNDLKASNMGLAKEIHDGSLLLAEKQTAIDALQQKLEDGALQYKEIADQYELIRETYVNLQQEHNGLLAEKALRVEEGEALVKLSERKAMAAFVVLDDLLERMKELKMSNSSFAKQIGEAHVTLAEKDIALAALQKLSEDSDVATRHQETQENLGEDHERLVPEKALRRTISSAKKEMQIAIANLKEAELEMDKVHRENHRLTQMQLENKSLVDSVSLKLKTAEEELLKRDMRIERCEAELQKVVGVMSDWETKMYNVEIEWRKEKEALAQELTEAKLIANEKRTEAAALLKKFEDGQATLKEAEDLVDALVKANENAKHDALDWKTEKESLGIVQGWWMPERDKLVSKIARLETDMHTQKQDIWIMCKETVNGLVGTMDVLLAVDEELSQLKNDHQQDMDHVGVEMRALKGDVVARLLDLEGEMMKSFEDMQTVVCEMTSEKSRALKDLADLKLFQRDMDDLAVEMKALKGDMVARLLDLGGEMIKSFEDMQIVVYDLTSEKDMALKDLADLKVLKEQGIAQSLQTMDSELKAVENERDKYQTDLVVLNEQLEIARTLANEREIVAAEALQTAERSKSHAEEKEEQARILERSVEELESTVYALESQLDIVKRESERQRVVRESLEKELKALKLQIELMQVTIDSQDAQTVRDLQVAETSKTELDRIVIEMKNQQVQARQSVESLQQECAEKDVQLRSCKAHIAELMLGAEKQASENQQKLKSLEAMVQHLKVEERKVNPAVGSVTKTVEKSTSKVKGAGSPFKCIGSSLEKQRSLDMDEELSATKKRLKELETVAASRQKEVFMLNTKLAEAESMTHDVVRDLLGVKMDIASYATLLNQQQVQRIAERARRRTVEAQQKEDELDTLRVRLNEFIEERESWLEEINRRQAEAVAARVSAEKLRLRDETLTTENDKFREDYHALRKNVADLEDEIKKLSGQQNLQQRIHHHAKIKEENNSIRLQNEDLSGKLRRMEILFTRVNDELARYRTAEGKSPFINFDEEARLQKKLQETEENRLQLAETLIGLCTGIMQAAGIQRASRDLDPSAAMIALQQLQDRLESLERDLSDCKLKARIAVEKRRLSDLRDLTPLKSICTNSNVTDNQQLPSPVSSSR